MKAILKFFLIIMIIFIYACSGNNENALVEIDRQVDSISSIIKDYEQLTFQNKENSEIFNGYFDKDGKPLLLTFESYPDFVEFFYHNGLVCIKHKLIGEEGAQGSETKYYFKDGKLFHYLNNNETKEINAEIEKAVAELMGIESESIDLLRKDGKKAGQSSNSSGNLGFLNEFVDKPSYDVSEDERLVSRLKAIVKGEGDYGSLISQLAYGDAIQKFGDVVVINGQSRVVVDEQGTQVTFVSIIVADLANDVISVGMSDEEGNTSVFYTEAPGTKYPKQLVDWFTEDYRNTFKLEVQ